MVSKSDDLKNGDVIKTGPAGITLGGEFMSTKHLVTMLGCGDGSGGENKKLQKLKTVVDEPVNEEVEKGVRLGGMDPIDFEKKTNILFGRGLLIKTTPMPLVR